MAAQLWLLRHGEAEPHDTRPDSERRLTERGEEQSRRAGRSLVALGVRFQAIYTSPKLRARDTAVLAGAELGVEPVEHVPLADGFDGAEARALVGPEERVLVVGHNPDFEQVVHDLTGGRVVMRKGGVAGVALGGAPQLLVLLRPRDLERMD